MPVVQVRAALQETGQTPDKAEQLFQSMAAKESETLLAFLVAIFKRLMQYLFPLGVRYNEDEVERVKEAIRKHPGKPILFLPTHKSHMDYLTVHYVCFISELPVPYVVAGDNLNIPLIGHILRMCGAFFIRRSFAGDVLYKATLPCGATRVPTQPSAKLRHSHPAPHTPRDGSRSLPMSLRGCLSRVRQAAPSLWPVDGVFH